MDKQNKMRYSHAMHVHAMEYYETPDRNLTHAMTCIDESEDMLSEITSHKRHALYNSAHMRDLE